MRAARCRRGVEPLDPPRRTSSPHLKEPPLKTSLALTAAACTALPARALQFQFTQTGHADAALVQGKACSTALISTPTA